MTTILEKIKDSVEQGHYKVTEQLINQALQKHVPALRIVEESMVPAMRQMGENYKNDQADIPKILSCARCMRKGLDLLAPYLETERGFYVEKQFLKAVKENPDVSIVCLSSLLTTACPAMKHVVKALRQTDTEHRLKIMVGGGAVTKEFADSIGADSYTENAVDAAEVAKTFIV